MKKKFVISQDCLPSKSPVLFFAVLWLLFDRAGIPGWGWGVYWTFNVTFTAVWLSILWNETEDKVPGFGVTK